MFAHFNTTTLYKTSYDFFENSSYIRANFTIEQSYFIYSTFVDAEIKFYTIAMEDLYAITLNTYYFEREDKRILATVTFATDNSIVFITSVGDPSITSISGLTIMNKIMFG